MLNQVILVGRLARNPEVQELENGKKVANITLAVPRSFKNIEGTYDTDFIRCIVWDNVASNTSEYCKKGDIVGLKGRLQSRIVEKNEKRENIMEVIGEKVTFLTSSKEKEEKRQSIGSIPDFHSINCIVWIRFYRREDNGSLRYLPRHCGKDKW